MTSKLFKYEYEIKLNCSLCETSIKTAFVSFSDTRLILIDRITQRVVIETSSCSSSVILDRLLSTGRSAALVLDHFNAATSSESEGSDSCTDQCGVTTCIPAFCGMQLANNEPFYFANGHVEEALRQGERAFRLNIHSQPISDEKNIVEDDDTFLNTHASLCKRRRKSCDKLIAVHMQQLLTPEIDCQLEHLVPVVVVHLADRRAVHVLLKKLTENWPLPLTLRHVKRVDSSCYSVKRYVRVILCQGDVDCALKCDWPIEVPRDSLHQVWVPLAPCNREQHCKAIAHWPCNFHPHHEAENVVESFSEDDFAFHFQHLIKLQKHQAACALDSCTGEELAYCVATNDSADVWVHHIVLQLIDLVARGQGGGAYWPLNQSLPEGWRCSDRRHLASTDYLCSNAVVYLTSEPCVLCAAALLHSRVRQVFFLDCGDHSYCRGAWTRCETSRIHCVPGVNHHYQVFRCRLRPLLQSL